jgi:hypothetical protein
MDHLSALFLLGVEGSVLAMRTSLALPIFAWSVTTFFFFPAD